MVVDKRSTRHAGPEPLQRSTHLRKQTAAVWQTITSIALPLIGVLGAFVSGGGTRLSKKISHHADLLGKLDGAPVAKEKMQALLAQEMEWLTDRESKRTKRKINWANLSGGIIFALLTGGGVYGLWTWSSYTYRAGSPLFILAVATLGLFGLFFTFFTGFLFLSIFEPAKTDVEKAAEAQAKTAKKLERDARRK